MVFTDDAGNIFLVPLDALQILKKVMLLELITVHLMLYNYIATHVIMLNASTYMVYLYILLSTHAKYKMTVLPQAICKKCISDSLVL